MELIWLEESTRFCFWKVVQPKNDYLDILTHANNYYESQVVLLYRKFLNRDPNSDEMLKGTQKYSSTGDYTAVQKDILSTNEFIGIEWKDISL